MSSNDYDRPPFDKVSTLKWITEYQFNEMMVTTFIQGYLQDYYCPGVITDNSIKEMESGAHETLAVVELG